MQVPIPEVEPVAVLVAAAGVRQDVVGEVVSKVLPEDDVVSGCCLNDREVTLYSPRFVGDIAVQLEACLRTHLLRCSGLKPQPYCASSACLAGGLSWGSGRWAKHDVQRFTI